MNDISQGARPEHTSRLARGIGVVALTTVLVTGLAGCMTGRTVIETPEVSQRNAVAPAGIDTAHTADRIAGQLAQQAAVNRANSERFAGIPADRVADILAREADGTAPTAEPTPPAPVTGMTADRLERMGGR